MSVMVWELESVQKQHALQGFLPIYVHSLAVDSVLEFDLYVFNGQEMVLFRNSHLPLTSESRKELLERNLSRLYVSVADRRLYQKHIQTHISQILADRTVDEFTKASIVYDSAKELVREVFSDPIRADNIRNCQMLIESTVQYVLEGQNAFHNMLRIMSFDYTVYTHSVNVCTFSLALAHAAGIEKTNELIELGTGALLHDIGKAKIPESILHKPGPLDQAEWRTIQQHPQFGVELISETDVIPQASYLPIWQHHERLGGTGYPKRLEDGEIHVYGRIVAIADAFDAMTTNRVYREAKDSFSTLQTMSQEKDCFDPVLLRSMIELMGPVRPDIG